MNLTPRWPALVLCLAIAGCASLTPQDPQPPAATASSGASSPGGGAANPQAGATAGKGAELTGVWQGQSWSNCNALWVDQSRCGAVNAITFTLLQEKSVVTGYYKCAYGNMDCRNMDDSGRVADGKFGENTGLLTMRVMMPDGSDCLFNGKPRGDRIQGGYLCLQGGGEVERGLWKAGRNY
jgi:hypothetical protein